jgi:hypothetical protein
MLGYRKLTEIYELNDTNLVKNNTKLRKVDTPILTTFLQAPIFVPTQKSASRGFDTYREIQIKQNYKEEVSITGPLLDMNKDFPIWATVLKQVELTNSCKVTIAENKLLENIGYSKSNINLKNKKVVEKKVENMMKVTIKIVLKDDEDATMFFNVLSTGKWDRKKKIFEFTVNEDLFAAYEKIRWKALDLDYYKEIKTEYAKALFCFYESHADKIIPIKIDKLLLRLGLENYSRVNNARRKLKQAHDVLKDIGFLESYDCYKSDNDGVYYYKVEKVKKKNRVIGV